MKLSGYVGYDTKFWNILGMVGITPWTQGSFFYFLGPCLLATSRNAGWMDIHEIFRIWTQEVIGYTVSRLSRLFHVLQTRRGGGLRSRSASCLIMVFISPGEHNVHYEIWNLFFFSFSFFHTISICNGRWREKRGERGRRDRNREGE